MRVYPYVYLTPYLFWGFQKFTLFKKLWNYKKILAYTIKLMNVSFHDTSVLYGTILALHGRLNAMAILGTGVKFNPLGCQRVKQNYLCVSCFCWSNIMGKFSLVFISNVFLILKFLLFYSAFISRKCYFVKAYFKNAQL